MVEDLVRFIGYGTLELVTNGHYRGEHNGIVLEGCTGLVLPATAFFVFHRLA